MKPWILLTLWLHSKIKEIIFTCTRCGDSYFAETTPVVPGQPIVPGPPIVTSPYQDPDVPETAAVLENGITETVNAAEINTTGTTERVLTSTIVKEYGYVYTGGNLVQMVVTTTTTADDETTTESETLNFSYDASGLPMAVTYNDTTYFYATNIQGDVTAILNTSGTAVVSYTYDAWGNILTTTGSMADTLGEVNPLRYRGYVYDTETGLYYVSSRYYDPEIGRFINADVYTSTGQGLLGNNMFAYCNNNPVNNVDPLGLWTISISGTLSGVFGLGISLSFGFAFDDQGNFDWQYSYAIPGVDDTVMVGGIGAGAGIAVQYTKTDTIYNLYGPATYVGASVGPGWYVGGAIVSFSDASNSC